MKYSGCGKCACETCKHKLNCPLLIDFKLITSACFGCIGAITGGCPEKEEKKKNEKL